MCIVADRDDASIGHRNCAGNGLARIQCGDARIANDKIDHVSCLGSRRGGGRHDTRECSNREAGRSALQQLTSSGIV
ncbi:hypothetical protein N8D55_12855 [Xanthomonas hortorum pv. pelargonii]|nr:hypothetical protein N8D55_12855 [Xanthomonas hortorum pv. pelargonii]